MALTVAQVSQPMGAQTNLSIGNFLGRVVDITFAASYTTGGDTLTAAALAMNGILGVIALSDPAPSGLATKAEVRSTVASTGLSATMQLFAASLSDQPQVFQYIAPIEGTAGTDLTGQALIAPYAGTVTSVTYTADATWTGQVTNYRTISLNNVTQSTVAATQAMSTTGNVATADTPLTIPLGAGVAVLKNDVFEWAGIHSGTGQADPGGLVSITIAPALAAIDLNEMPSGTNVSTLTGRFLVLGW